MSAAPALLGVRGPGTRTHSAAGAACLSLHFAPSKPQYKPLAVRSTQRTPLPWRCSLPWASWRGSLACAWRNRRPRSCLWLSQPSRTRAPWPSDSSQCAALRQDAAGCLLRTAAPRAPAPESPPWAALPRPLTCRRRPRAGGHAGPAGGEHGAGGTALPGVPPAAGRAAAHAGGGRAQRAARGHAHAGHDWRARPPRPQVQPGGAAGRGPPGARGRAPAVPPQAPGRRAAG